MSWGVIINTIGILGGIASIIKCIVWFVSWWKKRKERISASGQAIGTRKTGIIRWAKDIWESDDFNSEKVLGGFIKSSIFGGLVVLSFILMDAILLDGDNDSTGRLKSVRIALAAIVFIYLAFAYPPKNRVKYRRFLILGGAIVHQIFGQGTICLNILIGGSETNYFAGLMMVFVGIAIMIEWRPTLTILQLTLMTVSYGLFLVILEPGLPSALALSNFVFVVSGAVVSSYGAYVVHIIREESKNRNNDDDRSRILTREFGIVCGLSWFVISLVMMGAYYLVDKRKTEVNEIQFLKLLEVREREDIEPFMRFRNPASKTIDLSGSQVLTEDKVYNLFFPVGLKMIGPGEDFEVYLKENDQNCHIKYPESVNHLREAGVRIIGYRFLK